MLPGMVLGTEGELLRKFDVSRAVFREALRSLEFFGVATVKRGGGGGVAVSLPNPTATVDTAVLYLKYLRPDDVELRSFQRRLESDAIRLAALRASHSELIALLEAARLAIRSTGQQAVHLLSQASRQLIGLAENQALEFVVTLLSAATVERRADSVDRPPARRKQIVRQACLAVESAAAGRSPDQLGQALHGLYTAMASNDTRT
jgi:DNA-binding FadR family transcriptional regulator